MAEVFFCVWGTGKTAQAIAFLHYLWTHLRMSGPFLVIAPLATLGKSLTAVFFSSLSLLLLVHFICHELRLPLLQNAASLRLASKTLRLPPMQMTEPSFQVDTRFDCFHMLDCV